eukprot:11420966-Prorocentrum_lima.AAC.1
MTSSLVGSEMCIRDRGRGGVGAQAWHEEAPAEAEAMTGQEGRRRQRSICLLYTSDAADDM